jgi:hypothetical protein
MNIRMVAFKKYDVNRHQRDLFVMFDEAYKPAMSSDLKTSIKSAEPFNLLNDPSKVYINSFFTKLQVS